MADKERGEREGEGTKGAESEAAMTRREKSRRPLQTRANSQSPSHASREHKGAAAASSEAPRISLPPRLCLRTASTRLMYRTEPQPLPAAACTRPRLVDSDWLSPPRLEMVVEALDSEQLLDRSLAAPRLFSERALMPDALV